jgi:hypothetical protein
MDEEKTIVETPQETPNEGQSNPVEEQPAPMPSENKPTQESEASESQSERTRIQVEKLKKHNQELLEENNKLKSVNPVSNVFESVYGRPTPQGQVAPPATPLQGKDVPNFVTADGYVDVEAQSRFLNELNQRTQHAEQEARLTRDTVRRQEERRQVEEAHAKHPWLNPSNTDQFDPQAFELVRDRLVRNMWEGKEQSLSEVAQEVSRFHTPSVKPEEIKEQAVAEFKEKQAVKANVSAVQSGKGQPREEHTRNSELRERTLHGDDSALDERLRNI